jgi:hypothetical protein
VACSYQQASDYCTVSPSARKWFALTSKPSILLFTALLDNGSDLTEQTVKSKTTALGAGADIFSKTAGLL